MPSRVPGAAEAGGWDTWRTVVDQGLQLREAEPWRCGEGGEEGRRTLTPGPASMSTKRVYLWGGGSRGGARRRSSEREPKTRLLPLW